MKVTFLQVGQFWRLIVKDQLLVKILDCDLCLLSSLHYSGLSQPGSPVYTDEDMFYSLVSPATSSQWFRVDILSSKKTQTWLPLCLQLCWKFFQIFPLFKLCHESLLELISETLSVSLSNLNCFYSWIFSFHTSNFAGFL